MSAPRYTTVSISDALGISRRSVERRAAKESWAFEECPVRGGKQRYYHLTTLPKDIQDALQRNAIAAALPAVAEKIAAPVVIQAPEHSLTDAQRLERDARKGVRAAVQQLMDRANCTQEAALHTLLATARACDPAYGPEIERAWEKVMGVGIAYLCSRYNDLPPPE